MNMEEKLLLQYTFSKTRRYLNVMFVKKLMDVSLIKLEEEGVEKDPLWARLNSESKFVSKFKIERNDVVMNYMFHKDSLKTSEEDSMTVLQTLKYLENGFHHRYNNEVMEWCPFTSLSCLRYIV